MNRLTPRQAYALYMATRRGMQLWRTYGRPADPQSVRFYVQAALNVCDSYREYQ
jgi:hypothetical protein